VIVGETGFENMDWTQLTKDMIHMQARVNTVWNYGTGLATVSYIFI
jgi:hypothetical protein